MGGLSSFGPKDAYIRTPRMPVRRGTLPHGAHSDLSVGYTLFVGSPLVVSNPQESSLGGGGPCSNVRREKAPRADLLSSHNDITPVALY
jgi:hypothetical protein